MAFTAEILSIQPERDKHRVTFRFVDGSLVRGPFVQDRPSSVMDVDGQGQPIEREALLSDHQAWCSTIIPVEVDEVQRLVAALGAADAKLLRDALISEGIDYAIFDNALVKIEGTVTNPRTLQSAIVERIGSTAANRIRNKLRTAGYERLTAASEVYRMNI
jgi:hypothetical protein